MINWNQIKETAENLTQNEAIALVCCAHEKPYGLRRDRGEMVSIVRKLRDMGLVHEQMWKITDVGKSVSELLC